MIDNRCLDGCNSPLGWVLYTDDDHSIGGELRCIEESHTLMSVPVECLVAGLNGDMRFILAPRSETDGMTTTATGGFYEAGS